MDLEDQDTSRLPQQDMACAQAEPRPHVWYSQMLGRLVVVQSQHGDHTARHQHRRPMALMIMPS